MLRATKDHIATADTMLAAFTACIGFSVSIKTKFQIDRRLPVRAMLMINGRYASLNGEVESLDQGRNGLGRKEHKHEKCSNSKPTLIHNLMCRSKWLHNDAVMLSVPPNDRSSISNSQGQPLANTIFTARQKLYAKGSICGGKQPTVHNAAILKESRMTYLTVFASSGTLICCPLPIILVTSGPDAIMAALTSNVLEPTSGC